MLGCWAELGLNLALPVARLPGSPSWSPPRYFVLCFRPASGVAFGSVHPPIPKGTRYSLHRALYMYKHALARCSPTTSSTTHFLLPALFLFPKSWTTLPSASRSLFVIRSVLFRILSFCIWCAFVLPLAFGVAHITSHHIAVAPPDSFLLLRGGVPAAEVIVGLTQPPSFLAAAALSPSCARRNANRRHAIPQRPL